MQPKLKQLQKVSSQTGPWRPWGLMNSCRMPRRSGAACAVPECARRWEGQALPSRPLDKGMSHGFCTCRVSGAACVVCLSALAGGRITTRLQNTHTGELYHTDCTHRQLCHAVQYLEVQGHGGAVLAQEAHRELDQPCCVSEAVCVT